MNPTSALNGTLATAGGQGPRSLLGRSRASLLVAVGLFALGCRPGAPKSADHESAGGEHATPPPAQGALESTQGEALHTVWSSPADFVTPESVAFDATNGVAFVSNMGPRGAGDDAADGFVSRIHWEDKSIELRWIDGLKSPKGLSMDAEHLYIADTSELLVAARATGEIVARHAVEGPAALNGVDVGPGGGVYVNNKGYGEIYHLTPEGLELFVKSEELEQINGVLVEEGRLLVGTSGPGQLYAVDRQSREVTTLADGFGNFDAVKVDGQGGYVISNWSGAVYHWAPGQETRVLLDTEAAGVNAADVDYAPSEGLLFVPTFTQNKVVVYSGIAANQP